MSCIPPSITPYKVGRPSKEAIKLRKKEIEIRDNWFKENPDYMNQFPFLSSIFSNSELVFAKGMVEGKKLRNVKIQYIQRTQTK